MGLISNENRRPFTVSGWRLLVSIILHLLPSTVNRELSTVLFTVHYFHVSDLLRFLTSYHLSLYPPALSVTSAFSCFFCSQLTSSPANSYRPSDLRPPTSDFRLPTSDFRLLTSAFSVHRSLFTDHYYVKNEDLTPLFS